LGVVHWRRWRELHRRFIAHGHSPINGRPWPIPLLDVVQRFACAARLQLPVKPLEPYPPTVPVGKAPAILARLLAVDNRNVFMVSSTKRLYGFRLISNVMLMVRVVAATGVATLRALKDYHGQSSALWCVGTAEFKITLVSDEEGFGSNGPSCVLFSEQVPTVFCNRARPALSCNVNLPPLFLASPAARYTPAP
jgi:hypothetical protein